MTTVPDGDLVVVETGSGDVSQIDLSTGETTVLAAGLSSTFTALDVLPSWTQNSIAVAPSSVSARRCW